MNVERWGMSERAQEETKWRLGELARVHHIMVTRARSGCGANKKMAHDQLVTISTFVTVQSQEIHRHALALTISFSVRTSFFFLSLW